MVRRVPWASRIENSEEMKNKKLLAQRLVSTVKLFPLNGNLLLTRDSSKSYFHIK